MKVAVLFATREEKKATMNLLGISGSLSETSVNTALLRAMADLMLPETAFTLEVYQGLESLPHFRPDRDGEEDQVPETVRDLRERILAADGVIFCTPEYAHNLPGSLKNALDWTVSAAVFDAKPVAALSASPSEWGGDKALASLLQTLRVLGAAIPHGAILSIPFVRRKIDASGQITDPDTCASLVAVLRTLAEHPSCKPH